LARWRKLASAPLFSVRLPVILVRLACQGQGDGMLATREDEALGEDKERRDGSGGRNDTEIREHLANERTLLSWVRTGVSLISIGLVVERAGALADAANPKLVGTSGASELFGLALALLGVLTLVMGTIQFLRYRRRISEDDFTPSVVAYLVVVGGSLAFAGTFIFYVLFA
jgi:inner membrane protein YidH